MCLTFKLIVIVALVMTIYSYVVIIKTNIYKSNEALTYKLAYENTRSEIESLYRTIGRKVNSAYTCKLK